MKEFLEKVEKYIPIIRRILLVLGVLFFIAFYITMSIDDTGENPAEQIFAILFAVCFCTLIGSFILPWLFRLICIIGRAIPKFFCAIPGFFVEVFKKIGKLFIRFFKSGFARVVCEECCGALSESNVEWDMEKTEGFYRDEYDDLAHGTSYWCENFSTISRGKRYCHASYTMTCPRCGHKRCGTLRIESETGGILTVRREVMKHLGF
jgi:hypothetical protein